MSREVPVARPRRMARTTGAGALALVLILPFAAPATGTEPVTADAPADVPRTKVVADDLVDSGEYQQHWSSVPGSRIVLNPFDRDRPGDQLDQNAGPTLPLHAGYYAADEALLHRDLLRVLPVVGDEPTEEGYFRAHATSFDTLGGWTVKDVSAATSNGQARLTLDRGKAWGNIAREISVTDASQARYLTVDVGALSGGAAWNVKIDAGGGADLPELQADSTATGKVTFDLAEAYGWGTERRAFTVKIYATNPDGQASGAVTVRSLTLDNGGRTADTGDKPAFADDFSSESGWVTSKNGAILGSDGSQGTVRLGDASYGAVERTITVDLDVAPLLTIDVPQTSAKWALKVTEPGGSDVTVQADTDRTGVLTYDLAEATGWSGSRTFAVKLFHVGRNGWTSVDGLKVHDGARWLERATALEHTWHPAVLTADAGYASGARVRTADVFHDETSFSRTIDADGVGSVALAGAYEGSATFDAGTSRLTVAAEHDTYAVDLPPGARVRFATSVTDIEAGVTTSEPTPTSRAWVATAGSGRTVVGIGFAVNDDRVDTDPAAAAQTRAQAATSDPDMDAERWTDHWDDYLVRVPVPEDFTLQGVDTLGVEPEDVERFYYQGFVNLEQNVLPATPETGNHHVQLGTGKPSMWMKGTPGTKNVASWDSLLGMQHLVFVDPETAWGAFEGMMALVDEEGGLGGESLPSRKAQTALVLQQATGETDRLAAVYEDLARHLRWESEHLAWKNPGATPSEHERDAEFVVSLLVDLEYAKQVSMLVGRDADVAAWQGIIDDLLPRYQEWFFEEGGATYQKVWLDGSRRSEAGLTQYVATGLHVQDLEDETVDRLMARFDSEYDPGEQFAGLAAEAIKAPDAQLMIYGLLDQGKVERAQVLTNAITRDMVRSGWFAEVYQESGQGLESTPVARGVRPSLFGIAQLIDNVWMANGFRVDQGGAATLRMPGRDGGLTGMSHDGRSVDVDVTATGVTLSGPGADGLCTDIQVDAGGTVLWAEAMCEPQAQVEVTAGTRCLAGSAYVAARATNVGAVAAEIRLETPYGSRTGTAAPGASVYQAFAVRSSGVDAGEVTVTVTRSGSAPTTLVADYSGTSCG